MKRKQRTHGNNRILTGRKISSGGYGFSVDQGFGEEIQTFDKFHSGKEVLNPAKIQYPVVQYDPLVKQVVSVPIPLKDAWSQIDINTGRIMLIPLIWTDAEKADIQRFNTQVTQYRAIVKRVNEVYHSGDTKGAVAIGKTLPSIAPLTFLASKINAIRSSGSILSELANSRARLDALKLKLEEHPMQEDLLDVDSLTARALDYLDAGLTSPPPTLKFVDGAVKFEPDERLVLLMNAAKIIRIAQAQRNLISEAYNDEWYFYASLYYTPEAIASRSITVTWTETTCGFFCSIGKVVGGILKFVATAPFATLKLIPVVNSLYKGIDHITGGALTSIENIAGMPGRVIAGEKITAKELLDNLSFALKVGAVVLTGGAAAAVIGASAQQLKNGPLGDTALGRTLLDVASIAAVATAAVTTAQTAASNAASQGANTAQQAVAQATAQTAAQTGASVGQQIAQASVSDAIQNALIQKGEEMAKQALIAEIAKKAGPIGGLIAGAAAGGIQFNSSGVGISEFNVDQVVSTAVDKGKVLAIETTAKALGVPVGVLQDAMSIANGEKNVGDVMADSVNNAINNAKNAFINDPLGVAKQLFALANKALSDKEATGFAATAANLAATESEKYVEQPGTVKNIVTGQVYPTVMTAFYNSKITDEEFAALGLSKGEMQANLSNNARRLNTMIARFPNPKLTVEDRAANKMKLETELSTKIAKLNLKAGQAADLATNHNSELEDLIALGQASRKNLESCSDLSQIPTLNKQVSEIELRIVIAKNKLAASQASALRIMTAANIAKAQAALKVAAAEEGRFWPGMFDTAHPMLVYGVMERVLT